MRLKTWTVVVGVGGLVGCAEPEVRERPPDCAQRKAEVTRAEVRVVRLTEAARQALGEEAATLAWWKAREAETALDGAREAARGCP